MHMRDAHYPLQAPIEAYGHGGFRFANMSHRGSILVLRSGIYGWTVTDPRKITETSLRQLFKEVDKPELLLIGTGRTLEPAATGIRLVCAEHGIQIDVMNTGAAVRTYNILLAEYRSVGAALIAVD
jgi:uncharacterized protein